MSMEGVLRLYFGESNLPTPDYIKRAAIQAMAGGYTFYTENAGLPSLRCALAAYYRKLHGADIDPRREIVITASGVQALNVSLRCAHDPWLLADEVYDRLYYAGERLGDPVPSILRKSTRDDAVIVVHSFSKSYCMTGWRVGWLIARRDLIAKTTQLNEFVVSHAPTFAQKAGETALADGEEELLRMLERLKENRDLCMDALRGIAGVTVPKPDGAFYLFPKVDGLTDSFDFCRRLLEETRVGLAPGVAFGEGGEGSFRICYAAERSILEPAMERLTKFLVG